VDAACAATSIDMRRATKTSTKDSVMLRVILLCGLSLIASGAFAHTGLKSSVPGAQAVVAEPVSQIVLEFTGAVRLTAVTLVNGSGDPIRLGQFPVETQARFAVDVQEPLPTGDYVITWRAVGADTHVVSGEIPFRVSAGARTH
jgi:methionine-rich copper-binding protein CopC